MKVIYMKKILIILLSFIITVSAATPISMAEVTTYKDYKVEDSAYFADSFGLMSGYEDGTFRPKNPITRAEFTKSLMKAAEIAYPDTKPFSIGFSDLDKSHWAYDDIAKAVSIGFINGYEDGTFRPNNNITYEQAVTMIFSVLGYRPVAELYGGYPNAYISLAYYNRFFKTSIEERGYVIEMNSEKQKKSITRRDALCLLSCALTTPLCVVEDYKITFDGSKEPVYSVGGDGEVAQTLFTMKNTK